MWLILQQPEPDDFVIATGETHSVREFTELAFKEVGIDIAWRGRGSDEKGINEETGDVLVEVDPKYFRPTEVDLLIGDPSKAREKLGWNPTATPFQELIKMMMTADMQLVAKEVR